MSNAPTFKIALFEGDGIGPEVAAPCIDLVSAAVESVGGFSLDCTSLPAGAGTYVKEGVALPDGAMEVAAEADAILLAAIGDPEVRYPDGTEITPQIELRTRLGLYAGVRPVRSIPGMPPVLSDPRAADLDFVLIRESTEGLFAAQGNGTIEDDRVARDTMVISRENSERLFDFSFGLARKRRESGKPGTLTLVDKSNVFTSFAFFRRVFDERAALFPDVEAYRAYVDATALNMVRNPWVFDVMVTENMFGDILSDLGAGLIGGMGMAPSADIGDHNAVFQPCHGTAPDIVGQGKANPTAMILSAAMMLEWLGDRHAVPSCGEAGGLLRSAVDRAFSTGRLIPTEIGGESGTVAIAGGVEAALSELIRG